MLSTVSKISLHDKTLSKRARRVGGSGRAKWGVGSFVISLIAYIRFDTWRNTHTDTHTQTLYMPGIVQHEKKKKKKKRRKLHKLHHSTLGTTLNKPRWGRHSNNRAATVTTFLMSSSHGQWCTGGNSDKTSHNNGAPDSSASTLRA